MSSWNHARALFVCALGALLSIESGCSRKQPTDQVTQEGAGASGRGDAAGDAAAPAGSVLERRPLTTLRVPSSYNPAQPSPLLLVLHGYGSRGADHVRMFELGAIAEQERLIVAAPDGTLNARGARFWNAVPGCCDFEQQGIDDVAYLRGVVAELSQRYAIDPGRVYAIGHSNGGAMALRLACDASDQFAAVVDVAGPFYDEASAGACQPAQPVGVRVVHGTRDPVVPYDGGPRTVRVHPRAGQVPIASAPQKASAFAARLGCQAAVARAPFDLDGAIDGAETEVLAYEGCRGGAQVELWSVRGAAHAPQAHSWDSAWQFLERHRREAGTAR